MYVHIHSLVHLPPFLNGIISQDLLAEYVAKPNIPNPYAITNRYAPDDSTSSMHIRFHFAEWVSSCNLAFETLYTESAHSDDNTLHQLLALKIALVSKIVLKRFGSTVLEWT